MYPVDLENNERLCEYSAIVEYMVPGRFAPNPVRPLSRFAPGRFAPIPVRPGSFRPDLLIVL